jgi:hypothetical protein
MNRITTDGDNEITAYPWWAIINPERRGTAAVGSGPFFSRASAEEYLANHRYRYSKKAYVYCFSGRDAPDYREAINNGKVTT